LIGAIPTVFAEAWLTQWANSHVLRLGIGLGLVGLAILLEIQGEVEDSEDVLPVTLMGHPESEPSEDRGVQVLVSGIGGFLTGAMSAGLPEIVTTFNIFRYRLSTRVAIATSIFVLAICSAVGAVVHSVSASVDWDVVLWTIPGVVIGSAMGSQVGKFAPGLINKRVLGGVFGLVGLGVVGLEIATLV